MRSETPASPSGHYLRFSFASSAKPWFPALVLEKDDELMLVASGYTPLTTLKERVLAILEPQLKPKAG